MGVNAVLADERDEQADEAHDPALEGILPGDLARHHHAEHGQPKEFKGTERERDSPTTA